MKRISKILLFNPAEIIIWGIQCNYNNLAKVLGVFDYERMIMIIESVEYDSSLLAFIVNKKIYYDLKPRGNNEYDVSVVLNRGLFSDLLEEVIREYPENVVTLCFPDAAKVNFPLPNSPEELVRSGIANSAVFISFDENALRISVNKNLVQPKELYRKIKALRLS